MAPLLAATGGDVPLQVAQRLPLAAGLVVVEEVASASPSMDRAPLEELSAVLDGR